MRSLPGCVAWMGNESVDPLFTVAVQIPDVNDASDVFVGLTDARNVDQLACSLWMAEPTVESWYVVVRVASDKRASASWGHTGTDI
eukprot:12043320-Alexandrium_andersonii.AAC.1